MYLTRYSQARKEKIMKKIMKRLVALHFAEFSAWAMTTQKNIVPIYVDGQKIVANEFIRYVLYIFLIYISIRAFIYLIFGDCKFKKRPIVETDSIEEDEDEDEIK